MQRELDLYFKGRKRLAEMMDVPQPDSFTDKDMAVSEDKIKMRTHLAPSFRINMFF